MFVCIYSLKNGEENKNLMDAHSGLAPSMKWLKSIALEHGTVSSTPPRVTTRSISVRLWRDVNGTLDSSLTCGRGCLSFKGGRGRTQSSTSASGADSAKTSRYHKLLRFLTNSFIRRIRGRTTTRLNGSPKARKTFLISVRFLVFPFPLLQWRWRKVTRKKNLEVGGNSIVHGL